MMAETDSSKHALENAVIVELLTEVVNCPVILRACRVVNRKWYYSFNKKTCEKLAFATLERVIQPLPHGLGYSGVTHSFDPAARVSKIVNLSVRDNTKYFWHPDVIDFFDTNGIDIKYLSFQCGESEKTCAAHFVFLGRVFNWCTKLDELKIIALNLEKSDTSHQLCVQDDLSLKKLILDYGKIGFNSWSFPTAIVQKILEHSKSLQSFVFVTLSFDIDQSHFGILFRLMSHINKFSRNLTTLELSGISLNHETLSVITGAGIPLKSLIFSGYLHDQVTAKHFNEMINAYKTSLKHIHVEVHNFNMRNRKQVELNVDEVQNLEILVIDTENVNIGKSGLIGNLRCLRRLKLLGQNGDISVRSDIVRMFKNEISSSLKSVSLSYRSATDVSELFRACPNIVELEVGGLGKRLCEMVSAFNSEASCRSCLKDVTFRMHFCNTELLKNDWSMHLFSGLSGYRLRNLKFVGTSNSKNFHPLISTRWIQKGLLVNKNTFYRIWFEGCNIHANEVSTIARILVGRANIVNFTECNVVSDERIIPLKDCCIFQDIVEDFIEDIRQRVEKM